MENEADRPAGEEPPSDEEVPMLSQSEQSPLSQRLAKARHDLNSALSVIYGNTQLLLEIARAQELGEIVTEPLEDIREGQADISRLLDQLGRLHGEIDET